MIFTGVSAQIARVGSRVVAKIPDKQNIPVQVGNTKWVLLLL
jgi:hypothetical protein